MKARVGLAKSKLARAKSLIDVKAISQEEYEENVAALTEAQAQQVAAEADTQISALDLKYTEVKSPISGRIDRAQITPGNIVTGGLGTGTLLTTIVKTDPMYVYFDVDEQSVLRYQRMTIQKNQAEGSSPQAGNQRDLKSFEIPCFVQLGDEKDYPHRGKLDFLENTVDERTGTIKLRAVLDNSENLYKAGMFVRVRVPVSEPYSAVLVPEASIGVDQDTRYVIAIGADKKPARQSVQLGRAIGTWRVITKGLEAGAEVVYRGIQRVRPGAELDIQRVEVPFELGSSAKGAE